MEYSFVYSDNSWPLVVLTVSGAPNSKQNMENFLSEWSKVYTTSMIKEQRYRLVFDARKASIIELQYLSMLADYLIKIKDLTETWMEKTGILVSNPTVKALIQFVFKFYEPVRPFKVFNESDKCFEWVMSDQKGDEEHLEDFKISDLPSFSDKIDFSENGEKQVKEEIKKLNEIQVSSENEKTEVE